MNTATLQDFFGEILHEGGYSHPLGKKISDLLALLAKEIPSGCGLRNSVRWHRVVVVWETLPNDLIAPGFPNTQGPELRLIVSRPGSETHIPLQAEMFREPLETIVERVKQQLP